jgi:hypothetical protein
MVSAPGARLRAIPTAKVCGATCGCAPCVVVMKVKSHKQAAQRARCIFYLRQAVQAGILDGSQAAVTSDPSRGRYSKEQFIPCASRIDALEHNFMRAGQCRCGYERNVPYGCSSANLATHSGDTVCNVIRAIRTSVATVICKSFCNVLGIIHAPGRQGSPCGPKPPFLPTACVTYGS